jgi:hypothetical protein
MIKTVLSAAKLWLSARHPVRKFVVASMFTAVSVVAPAAHAEDPCKVVLCMFGKLKGESGGSECAAAEGAYFAILVKKHGKINWGKTASERLGFQNSCPTADRGKTKEINDKFGMSRG